MEDGKHKSEDSRRSHRSDKERNGERHREKRDHRETRRSEREKSFDSDDSHHLDREKDRGKHRSKDKDRRRARERDDKKRDRDRDREREKEKEKEKKEREREREREKEKEKKEREKEKEKERDRREREKEKRAREKEKRRESVSDDDDDSVRDRDRKRRKRREESPERKSPRREEGSEEKKPRAEPAGAEADEHVNLEEEMEKRRRRVQEWQELRRKKEEVERADPEEPKSGKVWTLEGEESDDEEAKGEAGMEIDAGEEEEQQQQQEPSGDQMTAPAVEEEEDVVVAPASLENGCDEEDIDPLDAFMNALVVPEVDDKSSDPANNGEDRRRKAPTGRIIPGEDSETDDVAGDESGGGGGDAAEDENDDEFMKRVKKTKAEKLALVDHSKVNYPPFRKNFYIEVKEISATSLEEVTAYRRLTEFKIHGKDVPKPVKAWNQTGLTTKILDIIKKLNYEKPMPIQAQALPVIMSGRDCIGIAKTGSGKTLAFVLPMLRHIKDQPAVVTGDGPIGLVMAPTRELVQQIHSDIRKFTKALGLRCVPVYGGAGVAQQISDLKRGAEIVVCTPGRMIDILCTSSGKITNLRRVTFLVMDEADRMFDMGFEPQISRIVQNIRPDRQTVLFSATFPRQVEILARRVLTKPVEIQVGGRSVVNKDIAQLVEVRPEKDRFLRLLELLGEWYEKGKILVFVQTHDKCDHLFREVLKHGYPCLSLHGGKDQTDRESTIVDFKTNVCNLLVATSIAARGLDVKDLELVVNYDAPNHYEDYVHRVGRTGRAGRKGLAITFLSEDEARYAPDLVKALELSEQAVPADLRALSDGFAAKVSQGLEQAHGTGYGGSGFKFNEEEDEVRRAVKKAQAKEYGFEDDKSDSDDDDNDGVRKAAPSSGGGNVPSAGVGADVAHQQAAAAAAALAQVAAIAAAANAAAGDGPARAAALAAAMNLQHNLAKMQADAMPEHYEAELEINDFPQNARWKVTHKETLVPISEWTKAAITTRGQFYPPGRIVGPGDRKLYLFIEGPSESSVKRAKAELKRVLEEFTNQAVSGGAQTGKYSVF